MCEQAENDANKKVKIIRIDNVTEFVNQHLRGK